ncbi:unnamed protein product [Withania somnifera]
MEKMVVEALLFGDRQAQLLAARQLAQFPSKQRHNIADKGIVPSLILMLNTNDYEAIEAALFALLSIAFCKNDQLVELGVAFLLTLSSCGSNKLEIASSGAIPLLLELLNSHSYKSTSLQANFDILSTLHNLSTCNQLIPSIVSYGGVATLLGLINLAPEFVMEKAMALLENLVSSSRIALEQAAGRTGAIQCLVEAMEEGSRLCKEHAVAILLLISDSCRDRYRYRGLSVDGTKRVRDNAKSLVLLLRDCSNCGQTTKQPKNIMLLEQIMRQIEQGLRARRDVSSSLGG